MLLAPAGLGAAVRLQSASAAVGWAQRAALMGPETLRLSAAAGLALLEDVASGRVLRTADGAALPSVAVTRSAALPIPV